MGLLSLCSWSTLTCLAWEPSILKKQNSKNILKFTIGNTMENNCILKITHPESSHDKNSIKISLKFTTFHVYFKFRVISCLDVFQKTKHNLNNCAQCEILIRVIYHCQICPMYVCIYPTKLPAAWNLLKYKWMADLTKLNSPNCQC